MGISELWPRWRPDRRIQFDPEYQKAHAFKNSFRPTKSPEEYRWVAEYAKFVLGQFQSAERTLDEKAESVMKLFGGGTGLLTLGAIVNLPKISVPTMVVLGIALILALFAMLAAAWVRAPRQSYLPPSVAWALAYAEKYEAASESRFIAQWHLACEGLRLTLRLKVKGVKIATWFGYWSIVAVALSLCSAIIWPAEQMIQNSRQREAQSAKELNKMSTEVPTSSTSTPDPSGASQTPDAALFIPSHASINGATDPSVAAEPQSIQFSFGDGDAPASKEDTRGD
jgi:hypothetical protein